MFQLLKCGSHLLHGSWADDSLGGELLGQDGAGRVAGGGVGNLIQALLAATGVLCISLQPGVLCTSQIAFSSNGWVELTECDSSRMITSLQNANCNLEQVPRGQDASICNRYAATPARSSCNAAMLLLICQVMGTNKSNRQTTGINEWKSWARACACEPCCKPAGDASHRGCVHH